MHITYHILSHSPQPAAQAAGCKTSQLFLVHLRWSWSRATLSLGPLPLMGICRFLCGDIRLSPAANFSMPPVVGRLRKPLPQLSLPPSVNHGFWLHQGLGAPVHDTTPRAKGSLAQTSTQICLKTAFATWAPPPSTTMIEAQLPSGTWLFLKWHHLPAVHILLVPLPAYQVQCRHLPRRGLQTLLVRDCFLLSSSGWQAHHPFALPCMSWAHNLRITKVTRFYPPTSASTATIQGCLYPCDACTLRAMHITYHILSQ